ncbi:hypothetical protein GCM10027517_24100 [Phycicoccus ginsengisoli]
MAFVNLAGRGLEIGPSYNPLVPKNSGSHIETVDHADRATLVEKFHAWGVPPEALAQIDEVDHIWRGGSLLDAVPGRGVYDYIVASHVIEHTVDLVGFLRDCSTLIHREGRVALVVPDKRFCFDRHQPLTSVGDVVDAHLAPRRFHSPGTLVDHVAYAVAREGKLAWQDGDPGHELLQHQSLLPAIELIESALAEAGYHDAHHWKFTPASFALLIRDLGELGFHDLEVVGSAPTEGFEFFVTLGHGAPSSEGPRHPLLQQVEDELALPWLTDLIRSSLPALATGGLDAPALARALAATPLPGTPVPAVIGDEESGLPVDVLDPRLHRLATNLAEARTILRAPAVVDVGVEIPANPPPEVQAKFVGQVGAPAYLQAYSFVAVVNDLLERRGLPRLADCGRVMDFGSGWGRVSRLLLGSLRATDLYALDVDSSMTALVNTTLPGLNALTVDPFPPTALRSDAFGAVLSFSVFSHLSKQAHIAWAAELGRLVHPGGWVALTLLDDSFFSMRAEASAQPTGADAAVGPSRENSDDLAADIEGYREGRFWYRSDGSDGPRTSDFYGWAVAPPSFVERVWGEHGFTVVDWIPAHVLFPEALVLLARV